MQLFGGEWNFDDHTPAANFNRFPIAMLTVFQVGLTFFSLKFLSLKRDTLLEINILIKFITLIELVILSFYLVLSVCFS